MIEEIVDPVSGRRGWTPTFFVGHVSDPRSLESVTHEHGGVTHRHAGGNLEHGHSGETVRVRLVRECVCTESERGNGWGCCCAGRTIYVPDPEGEYVVTHQVSS